MSDQIEYHDLDLKYHSVQQGLNKIPVFVKAFPGKEIRLSIIEGRTVRISEDSNVLSIEVGVGIIGSGPMSGAKLSYVAKKRIYDYILKNNKHILSDYLDEFPDGRYFALATLPDRSPILYISNLKSDEYDSLRPDPYPRRQGIDMVQDELSLSHVTMDEFVGDWSLLESEVYKINGYKSGEVTCIQLLRNYIGMVKSSLSLDRAKIKLVMGKHIGLFDDLVRTESIASHLIDSKGHEFLYLNTNNFPQKFSPSLFGRLLFLIAHEIFHGYQQRRYPSSTLITSLDSVVFTQDDFDSYLSDKGETAADLFACQYSTAFVRKFITEDSLSREIFKSISDFANSRNRSLQKV